MPSQPRPILKRASHSFTPSSPTSSYFPSTAHPPETNHIHAHNNNNRHTVRFPPSPTLTRTFSAHSSSSYDRSPIVVLPNSCALPARGCPGRTYVPGDVSPPREGREGKRTSPKRSPSPSPEKRCKAMKSQSRTLHPRVVVSSSPGLQPIALPLPYSSSPLASVLSSDSLGGAETVTLIPSHSHSTPIHHHHHHHHHQHTHTSEVPTHLPDLTFTSSSSASESDESDGFVSPAPPTASLSTSLSTSASTITSLPISTPSQLAYEDRSNLLTASLSSLTLSAPSPSDLSVFDLEDSNVNGEEELTPPADILNSNSLTSLTSLSSSTFIAQSYAPLSSSPSLASSKPGTNEEEEEEEEDEAYEEYYTYEEETRRRRKDRDRDRRDRKRRNERNGGRDSESSRRALGLGGTAGGKSEGGGTGAEEEEEEEGEGGDADDDIGGISGRKRSGSGSGAGSGRHRGSKGGRGRAEYEEGEERGRYKSFGMGLRFGGFDGEGEDDDGCLGGF